MGDGFLLMLFTRADAQGFWLEVETTAIRSRPASELLGIPTAPDVGVQGSVRLRPILVEQGFVVTLDRLTGAGPGRRRRPVAAGGYRHCQQETECRTSTPCHQPFLPALKTGSCRPA